MRRNEANDEVKTVTLSYQMNGFVGSAQELFDQRYEGVGGSDPITLPGDVLESNTPDQQQNEAPEAMQEAAEGEDFQESMRDPSHQDMDTTMVSPVNATISPLEPVGPIEIEGLELESEELSGDEEDESQDYSTRDETGQFVDGDKSITSTPEVTGEEPSEDVEGSTEEMELSADEEGDQGARLERQDQWVLEKHEDMMGNSDRVISGGDAGVNIMGTDAADTIETGAGDDCIDGGAGDDVIRSGAGDDVLFGGEGVDCLFGGDGSDIFHGGAGNDFLFGDGGADTFHIYADQGNDTIDGGTGYDTMQVFGTNWNVHIDGVGDMSMSDFMASDYATGSHTLTGHLWAGSSVVSDPDVTVIDFSNVEDIKFMDSGI